MNKQIEYFLHISDKYIFKVGFGEHTNKNNPTNLWKANRVYERIEKEKFFKDRPNSDKKLGAYRTNVCSCQQSNCSCREQFWNLSNLRLFKDLLSRYEYTHRSREIVNLIVNFNKMKNREEALKILNI